MRASQGRPGVLPDEWIRVVRRRGQRLNSVISGQSGQGLDRRAPNASVAVTRRQPPQIASGLPGSRPTQALDRPDPNEGVPVIERGPESRYRLWRPDDREGSGGLLPRDGVGVVAQDLGQRGRGRRMSFAGEQPWASIFGRFGSGPHSDHERS